MFQNSVITLLIVNEIELKFFLGSKFLELIYQIIIN